MGGTSRLSRTWLATSQWCRWRTSLLTTADASTWMRCCRNGRLSTGWREQPRGERRRKWTYLLLRMEPPPLWCQRIKKRSVTDQFNCILLWISFFFLCKGFNWLNSVINLSMNWDTICTVPYYFSGPLFICTSIVIQRDVQRTPVFNFSLICQMY